VDPVPDPLLFYRNQISFTNKSVLLKIYPNPFLCHFSVTPNSTLMVEATDKVNCLDFHSGGGLFESR
jgi:hypothetical protein